MCNCAFSLRRSLVFLAMAALASQALARDLVQVSDEHTGRIIVQGFEIEKSQAIEVVVSGPKPRGHGLSATAWILDTETRTTVWVLEPDDPKTRNKHQWTWEETVGLGPGVYETYMVTRPEKEIMADSDDGWWSKALSGLFSSADEEQVDWQLNIEGVGRRLSESELARRRDESASKMVVKITARRDGSSEKQLFELTEAAEIEVYAVGEIQMDGRYDWGGIIDMRTREKVWALSWKGSRPAGGAAKNRQAKVTLKLPAGRYLAFYSTDDSHSPQGWNDNPPYDPQAWGLQISERSGAAVLSEEDPDALPAERTVVNLSTLGNDQRVFATLEVNEKTKLRLHAVGEGTKSSMSDYGWILRLDDRKKIWKMHYRSTEHAGGAYKNRLVDEVIELAPGRYRVTFRTDDSHAFDSWNAMPPRNPERWGLTLVGLGEDFDPSKIKVDGPWVEGEMLVALAPVRNDRLERQELLIHQPTAVAMYCLGEGDADELVDYGWLEDSSGRRVWEMRAQDSQHAGGAMKNRMTHQVLELAPGLYVATYRTDDSHAYGAWNSSPPDDPNGWGLQISVVKKR